MAILSKVKSAVGKVVSKVKGGISSLSKAIGGQKQGAFASAITSLSSTSNAAQRQTIAPNISTPQGIGRANPNGSITLLGSTGQPTNKVITSSGAGSTIAPSTITGASPIYSAPTTLRGGQTSTSTMSYAPTSEDTVITSESMGGSSSSLSSEGGSMSSSPSISLPSSPTYADPGQINNGGLISSLADSYSYDAEKNMFVPVATAGAVAGQPQTETDKRTKLQDMLQKLIPKKDSLYEDPLIRQQNEEINRRKQEVNNYTAQLNSVVAQQNADLLRLRGIGSQEGVTETVYGGQAATINREAAIKALPIQAQLSAAQGNLQLAQDYLTQLTTWKKEEIDNEYNYKTALYSSIKDFVKGEEKIRLDQLEKENDRAYQERRDFIALQDSLMKEAISSGNPGLVSSINSARSRQELGNLFGTSSAQNDTYKLRAGDDPWNIAKQYGTDMATLSELNPQIRDWRNVNVGTKINVPSSTTPSYTKQQEKDISAIDDKVSKNATYAKTTAMRGYVDNVVTSLSQSTGAGDLAAINQFQKVIDEGAVTRDQDVKLIQSSQSLSNRLKTQVKKLEKGQQLSPELRTEMRTAVEALYDAQTKALKKDPFIQTKINEAKRKGIRIEDTILGQLGALGNESSGSGQVITAPDGTQVIITD